MQCKYKSIKYSYGGVETNILGLQNKGPILPQKDADLVISHYDGMWRIDVNTKTILEEDSYYGPYYEPELSLSEKEVGYELVYNEENSKWLVSYTGWGSYLDDSNMTEYREAEPVTYTSEWE